MAAASAGTRSASPQKGAGAGKGSGGAREINKVSKANAATGKGSAKPPKRGSPKGR